MELPKIKENIRVKITNAHNVYFVYPNKEKNSMRPEEENVAEFVNSWKRKADMATTSVQTDPEEGKPIEETFPSDVQPSSISSEYHRSPTIPPEQQNSGDTNENNLQSRGKRQTSATNQLAESFQALRIGERATNVHDVEGNQRLDGSSAEHSENAPSKGTQTYISTYDLFKKIIEKKYPKSGSDLIKIIVTHSELDTELAKTITDELRKNDRFWAVANYELEDIMSLANMDFRKAAISWADILVPVVTNTWLSEIDNVSKENRSTSSLNAKYTFQLIQTNYVASACTNLKVISVVKEGTDIKYRKRPEIRDAIPVMKEYRRFETMIVDFHRIVTTCYGRQNGN